MKDLFSQGVGALRKAGNVIYKQNNVITALILTCMLTISAHATYSQSKQISLNLTNVTVKEALETVKRQSNYSLSFNTKDLDVRKKVSINVVNVSIQDALSLILKDQNVSYSVEDRKIVIIKKQPTNNGVEGSKKNDRSANSFSGKVVDERNQPLPGATVIVKETGKGIITNPDGTFSIDVPNPESLVLLSFIGYKPVEVMAKNISVVNLQPDAQNIEEVVVTGYQTISKERATGSFQILNSEKLNKTLAPDLITRLDGKIAGLQINKNGITIRGRGSIMSSNEPLFVVDGFPVEGGLSTINPDDIENVSVLKDAAAASIWGVRAANGVIVITTKAGKKSDKPRIDVSAYYTINEKSDLSHNRIMSSAAAVDLALERIQKGWWSPSDVTHWNSEVNKVEEAYYNTLLEKGMEQTFDEVVSDPKFIANLNQLKKANLRKQFEKELMRNASQERVNASLRGGSEKNAYYLSTLFNFNQHEAVGDDNNEILLNFRNDYNLSKRFTFSSAANIRYNSQSSNGVSSSDLKYEEPFHNILDENGNRIQYYMVDPWEGARREQMGYLPYTTNMLDVRDHNNNKHESFSARVQAVLSLKLIEGLTVETRFQYEKGFGKNESIKSVAHPDMRRIINGYTLVNADGSLNRQFPLGEEYGLSNNDFEAWTWRNQLSFNRNFTNRKHQISAILGQEMRLYRNSSRSTSQYGFDSETLQYIPIDEAMWYSSKYPGWSNLGAVNFSLFSKYLESDNRDVSFYANGSYTYDSKYTLTASGRIDQSNIYGNDSKYKYNMIWSSGFSWRISEERFAKADWLNSLLLRATYGIGGNVNKQFYPVLMGKSYIDYYSGATYISLTNPANKDLKWETTKTFNLGVDFATLSNRLNVNVDFYNRKGEDLLGRAALDPTNGFSSAQVNFASLVNRGIELTVNTTPIVANDFKWDFGFNLTYNKNEVKKVESEGSSASAYLSTVPGNGVALIGKPLSRLYAYPFAGLNNNGEPMYWENGEKVNFWEYSKDPSTLKYLGQTDAPWFGGVSTSLTYKGFTLSANATFKVGHKFLLPSGTPSSVYNYDEYLTGRWQKPGDENFTNVPGLKDHLYNMDQYNLQELYRSSDILARNAGYIRFNELSLNYSFKKQMLSKLSINGLDLCFQIRNLALWTANKEGVDPETVSIDSYGQTSVFLPEPRSFIVGLKVNF